MPGSRLEWTPTRDKRRTSELLLRLLPCTAPSSPLLSRTYPRVPVSLHESSSYRKRVRSCFVSPLAFCLPLDPSPALRPSPANQSPWSDAFDGSCPALVCNLTCTPAPQPKPKGLRPDLSTPCSLAPADSSLHPSGELLVILQRELQCHPLYEASRVPPGPDVGRSARAMQEADEVS